MILSRAKSNYSGGPLLGNPSSRLGTLDCIRGICPWHGALTTGLGHSRRFGDLPSTSGPSPSTDIEPIPRLFGNLSMEAESDDRDVGSCPHGRSAKSSAVAYSRVLARVRLQRHS